ncbi:type-F conjugative transfer system pilin assembly protein TrbC [Sphingomonas sp. H39-1-10]|uniref:type-F conjugative transfer system pilin assembly protein TrbC n=1 Tax=Sphingomonas pollutisoli TaxID=3030829 RepID=UPI0023B96668|nr:type-F conjugative transfer system pilin assembly protein TrbC [Sphingomonas pollutisoli]MDF0491149.1 type-F conjugative transfer system pilin assembly protein TrbC [Sphingomonas pollutisoli]
MLVAIVALPMASLAQDRPSPGAREKAQAEGDAAMERVKRAVSNAKQTTVPSPTLPAPADEGSRRRAFEGLNGRKADPALAKRAADDVAKARADVAAERERASARIAQALGLEAPDAAALAGAAPTPAPTGWVPVLMVSSSMPVAVLRTYAAQLEKAGGVLAFRGMPGGMTKVAPMARLAAQILRIDPGCDGPACAMRDVQVIVDPILFRQHAVARVPALAMIPGDPTQPYCEREESSPRSAHVVYGDSALSGLLDEYARLGGREEVRDAQARLARR